ncbi:uncharacterized protein F5Z01DRAFT_750400 [Emericellopsis atlantica]|uniref:T6SS Phospholipase effector Tle1-like catalytic domain-containing protein n=1 Tax=Emericellopsis atlantica TaxID=2614577 RepID=A0A9P8CPS9_9HYPO|nr:uncharacterized protein F5Z01DRAFT_750400 [Emericellopsis atlantica]KAG9254517.1 hypothetical protein F5Z01DRAFT_750400 [Emericellopsis atlantica]
MPGPKPNGQRVASYKRIILCADGTWLASDLGTKEVPSNVATVARTLSPTGSNSEGELVPQIVFYHSGLGSGALPLQKAISGECIPIPSRQGRGTRLTKFKGGLGWGLDLDICQIYEFIAENYEPGDELFFFGFSRGAFTVRSVAGLVCDVGVLSKVDMAHFPALWHAYQNNQSGQPFASSPWYQDNAQKFHLSSNVRIKVIAVWETVGALVSILPALMRSIFSRTNAEQGIPEWPLVKALEKIGVPVNSDLKFYNTNLSPGVDYAFQALALDEQRLTFPPTMWHKTEKAPAIDLEQCWFPGVHANLGGQGEIPASQSDHGEIGNISFAWMVDNVAGMLTFNGDAIDKLVKQHQHAFTINAIPNGWGCGPIISDFAGVQGAFFRLLGQQDRTPGNYPRDPGDGQGGATNESFHPIVRLRKRKVPAWTPKSIQDWSLKEPHGGQGWSWSRIGLPPMREWSLRKEKMHLAVKVDGLTRFEVGESLSRRLCPPDILMALDREQ